MFAGIILSGSIYALPQFLRNVFPHPLSATQTGRIMSVYALTAALIRPLVSLGIARFGQRKAMTFAFTMLVLSMLLFARLMTTGTPDIYYALPLILYAFCLAPMLSAIASGTVSKLPLARQLDAVAIYMSFRQFGASFGVTLVTILLDWRETMHSSVLYAHLRGMAPAAAAWAWPVAGAGGGSRAQDWMAQGAQFAALQRDTATLAAARAQGEVLRAQVEEAKANVAQGQAALDQAKLNLSYTKIYAPTAGTVANRSVQVGSFVQPGQTLFSAVPNEIYVTANFKETQLTHMRVGQPVTIHVDAFPKPYAARPYR